MRKQINGLSAIVESTFKLDPYSSAIFVFCNGSRNRIKILEWDGDGYWLYLKRLEKGKFGWVDEDDSELTMTLTDEELSHLLGSTKVAQKLKRTDLKLGNVTETLNLPPSELERLREFLNSTATTIPQKQAAPQLSSAQS